MRSVNVRFWQSGRRNFVGIRTRISRSLVGIKTLTGRNYARGRNGRGRCLGRYWISGIRDNFGRSIRRCNGQTTGARTPPNGGDKKPGLGIYGSGCYNFCARSWTPALERQQLVQRCARTSHHALGGNPSIGSTPPSIWIRYEVSSGKAARIRGEKKG